MLTRDQIERAYALDDDVLATLAEVSRHDFPVASPQEYDCGCITVIRVTGRRGDNKPFEMRLAHACGTQRCELAKPSERADAACPNPECTTCSDDTFYVVSEAFVQRIVYRREIRAPSPGAAVAIFKQGTQHPASYDYRFGDVLERHPVQVELDKREHDDFAKCWNSDEHKREMAAFLKGGTDEYASPDFVDTTRDVEDRAARQIATWLEARLIEAGASGDTAKAFTDDIIAGAWRTATS